MFWIKFILVALSLGLLFVARVICKSIDRITWKSNVPFALSTVLGIAFCILMAETHWNIMIIPKVIVFISVCLYVLFKEELETCGPFWMGILIAFIAWIITGYFYIGKLEKTNDPDVAITTCNVLCAKDGTMTSGSFSGTIIYVHGSSSEKSVYKYYYQQEDGGIKLGSISVDDTTLYFLEDGEEPRIETISTTWYYMNYNNNPATRCLETTNITYKLYIPEGSITNVYEFDTE